MPISKRLRLSGRARKDLKQIGAYTQREWGIIQKRKYLGQINECLKLIRDTPSLGALRDDINAGLRVHIIARHVIFYRETINELIIVRILHVSMYPKRHI